MPRFFAELAYNGSAYFGWQKQPGQDTVQERIEQALALILRQPIEVVGCGRTDTGVHASQYFLHFDFEGGFPTGFLRRWNKVLPKDIAVYRIFEVAPDAHARFDAIKRSYRYQMGYVKDPFHIQTCYFYPFAEKPNFEMMQTAATLLLNYQEFFPFCKSNHDAETMICRLARAEWQWEKTGERLVFHIESDRFLRGMVRLIVGMCINVGLGRLELETVKHALEHQELLLKAESAPPEGLFLCEVAYLH